jgi:large subunit ribosomal protein L1
MKEHSKRYEQALKKVEAAKEYSLKDAIGVLKQFPTVKFDETVELHFYLNIDAKKTELAIRGTTQLPHGTGKKSKILVLCKGEHQRIAKEAGADYVGAEELIAKVATGWLDFDKVIATPEMMRDLSKLGKVLGPRGLMPSPKTGTVTDKVDDAISQARAGKIEYKMDKQAGIHVGVGKLSFAPDKIFENAQTVIDAVAASRPAQVKGKYIKSLCISSSMGPGVRLAS